MTREAVATGFDPGVQMKVGIVGTGAVGAATGLALVERGVCRDIVLIDRDPALAAGVALDLRYASALSRAVDIRAGGYHDLAGAALVILTAGVNERAAGATDRADPRGRVRLGGAHRRGSTSGPRVPPTAPTRGAGCGWRPPTCGSSPTWCLRWWTLHRRRC